MAKTFKDRKDIKMKRKEISKLKRNSKFKKSWKEDYEHGSRPKSFSAK